jgi:acylphosphatase
MTARGMRTIVRGRVQGVGYRAFVLREARRLGLAGYARNLPDGSVEVVAGGDALQLDVLAERLRAGPPLARVDGIERSDVDPPPAGADFGIRP